MRYLITGGTGSLGTALVKKLVNDGHDIITIARNEGKLLQLRNEFGVSIVSGDIFDKIALAKIFNCYSIDGIFHFAALKHVTMCQNQPRESIKTNIVGTMNLLEETMIHKIPFILGVSTDKAAQINGVYGASKYLMEMLFHEYEAINQATKYRLVRYGNVLYSTGSVLCVWRDKIKSNESINVTDINATRFFWSIDQALDLIFQCLSKATNSQPYIPEMKGASINHLLQAMIKKYGNNYTGKINIIGLQKGENLHEKIASDLPASNEVQQYSIDELVTII